MVVIVAWKSLCGLTFVLFIDCEILVYRSVARQAFLLSEISPLLFHPITNKLTEDTWEKLFRNVLSQECTGWPCRVCACRLTEDCEQRVKAMESLDMCSQNFSSSRSEEAVRSQSSRMLCDVLLDQAIMPGVGNIIKNEALFDSGLHPAVKVWWIVLNRRTKNSSQKGLRSWIIECHFVKVEGKTEKTNKRIAAQMNLPHSKGSDLFFWYLCLYWDVSLIYNVWYLI